MRKPEEMKLNELRLSDLVVDREVLFNKEWVMDPPPFLVPILPDDMLVKIYGIKLKHTATLYEEVSQLILSGKVSK